MERAPTARTQDFIGMRIGDLKRIMAMGTTYLQTPHGASIGLGEGDSQIGLALGGLLRQVGGRCRLVECRSLTRVLGCWLKALPWSRSLPVRELPRMLVEGYHRLLWLAQPLLRGDQFHEGVRIASKFRVAIQVFLDARILPCSQASLQIDVEKGSQCSTALLVVGGKIGLQHRVAALIPGCLEALDERHQPGRFFNCLECFHGGRIPVPARRRPRKGAFLLPAKSDAAERI
jgi:hypothetical protein